MPESGELDATLRRVGEGAMVNQPRSVIVESLDGVAHVRLARPSKHNSLGMAEFIELAQVIQAVGNSSVNAMVLSGDGPSFCAGLDLDEGLGDGIAAAETTLRAAARVVMAIRDLPQPVIGALHGHVVGVGLAMALACDVVHAAPGTSFRAPFVQLGLSAGDPGLTWLLPRVIGHARARHLLLTGEPLTAEDAERFGLVASIEPDVEEHARRTAVKLAQRDVAAVRATKRLLTASLSSADMDAHVELELQTQTVCSQSKTFGAKLREFASRRRRTQTITQQGVEHA